MPQKQTNGVYKKVFEAQRAGWAVDGGGCGWWYAENPGMSLSTLKSVEQDLRSPPKSPWLCDNPRKPPALANATLEQYEKKRRFISLCG